MRVGIFPHSVLGVVMLSSMYIEHHIFHLIDDAKELRNHQLYDEIKAEVNKQNQPFSGGVDWEVVAKKCTLLASKSGLDLLLSCYYTVAAAKLHGVVGLANGLELLSTSLLISSHESKNANKRKELIEWVSGCVIDEIKRIKPGYERLRDLYRCERYCEQIDKICMNKQPEHVANMDSLAYVIFEHIDRLEIENRTQHKITLTPEHQTPSSATPTTSTKWYQYALLVIMSVFMTYWLVSSRYHFEPAPYAYSAFMSNKSLSVKDSRLLNDYISNRKAKDLSWLGDTPQLQDKNLSKLATIGNDKNIAQFKQRWLMNKDENIEAVDLLVKRFDTLRTQLFNVNAKLQNTDLKSLRADMLPVVQITKSLSPIYARIGYIERLLKQGDKQRARKELNILNERLKAISWKVIQLNDAFS